MGELDFGLTPNVWRPSLVPYPSTGEDQGFAGGSTTVTQETFNYGNINDPPVPSGGWQLIQNPFSSAKITSVIRTTTSTSTIKALTDYIPAQASHWMVFIVGTVDRVSGVGGIGVTASVADALAGTALTSAVTASAPNPVNHIDFVMQFRLIQEGVLSGNASETSSYVDANGVTKNQRKSVRIYQNEINYVVWVDDSGGGNNGSVTPSSQGGAPSIISDFANPIPHATWLTFYNKGALAMLEGWAVNVQMNVTANTTASLVNVYTYWM